MHNTFPVHLTPIPLTAERFAPFGDVIEADQERSYLINEGHTRRYHALAPADPGEQGAAVLSIFRGTPWPTPVMIRMLERHPLASQSFVPMERHTWVVVVASAPRAEACEAFLARGDQGVRIGHGVWHHPLLVLQPTHDFLVVDRVGPGDNLEEVSFAAGRHAVLAPV